MTYVYVGKREKKTEKKRETEKAREREKYKGVNIIIS
jgi:hypothetical protein